VIPSITVARPTINFHTGKSTWLYYALRRCLAERRPAILLHRRIPHLFVEDGVYRLRGNFQLADYKKVLWTLVDSDESLTGIPDEFVTQNTPFFVVYATSPARERWSRLKKTTFNAVIIMNPWSRGEIHRAYVMPYNLRCHFRLLPTFLEQTCTRKRWTPS
jgi:hypothetical protein